MLAPLFCSDHFFNLLEGIQGRHMWFHFETLWVENFSAKRNFRRFASLENNVSPFSPQNVTQCSQIFDQVYNQWVFRGYLWKTVSVSFC